MARAKDVLPLLHRLTYLHHERRRLLTMPREHYHLPAPLAQVALNVWLQRQRQMRMHRLYDGGMRFSAGAVRGRTVAARSRYVRLTPFDTLLAHPYCCAGWQDEPFGIDPYAYTDKYTD